VKVSDVALVMVGGVPGADTTVMLRLKVAVDPEELVALMVTGKVAGVAVVVPEMVAVPVVPGVKVSPVGRVPDSVMVGAGNPVVVTV
jgi:hypothetical protein